jgi:hypothetical protein
MGSSNLLPFQGKNGWANLIAPGASSIVNALQPPSLGQNPAKPLNFQDIINNGTSGGSQIYSSGLGNVTNGGYSGISNQQFGTVNSVAKKIAKSPQEKQALAATDHALGNVNSIEGIGSGMGSLAGVNTGLAASAVARASSPTPLTQKLQDAGLTAMNNTATQVSAPGALNYIQAPTATAAQMAPVDNVTAANATAAQMAPVDNVTAASMRAAQISPIQQVRPTMARAQTTESSGLGNQLLRQAQDQIASGGQLSPEALRNASQQAAATWSANGLGTGASAAAAGILNRDAATNARLQQYQAFGQNVNNADTALRQANTNSLNQFGLSNQAASNQGQIQNQNTNLQLGNYNAGYQQQAGQTNAQLDQQAGIQNQNTQFGRGQINTGNQQNANTTNAGYQQQAGIQNQTTQYNRNQFNTGNQQNVNLANAGYDLSAQSSNLGAQGQYNGQDIQRQGMNQSANLTNTGQSQNFLLNANQGVNQSNNGNAAAASGLLGNSSNMLGQSASAYGSATGLGYQGAGMYNSLNPYTMSLGYSVPYTAQNLGFQSGLVNNSYGQGMELAGNVPSFNTNLASGNWATGAKYDAGNYASQMGLVGSALSTAGKVAGAYYGA